MKNNVRKPMDVSKLTRIALIAGIYATLSLPFADLSFKAFQVRFPEALALLPIFDASAVPGLAFGCVIANIYGYTTGRAPAIDIVVGSLTTLLCAALTRKFRNITFKDWPLLSALPPIILNAIIIGIELSITDFGFHFLGAVWLKNILSVGFGQIIAVFLIGLPLSKLFGATIYRHQRHDYEI